VTSPAPTETTLPSSAPSTTTAYPTMSLRPSDVPTAAPSCPGGVCDSPEPPQPPPCFASMAKTMVRGKGMVAMKDLSVGDCVMTASGKFQTVYAMDHFHRSKPTEFLRIHTTMTNEQPLELTSLHMVFLEGKLDPIPASLVMVGDGIATLASGESHTVTKIDKVVRNGFYNALTADGTIVVDGVVASTYASLTGKEHIGVGGMQFMSQHDFVHSAVTPIRVVCKIKAAVASVLSLELSYSEDTKQKEEYFAWYSQLHNVFFGMLHGQNGFIQLMILVPVTSLFSVLSLFSSLVGVISFALPVATAIFFNRKRI